MTVVDVIIYICRHCPPAATVRLTHYRAPRVAVPRPHPQDNGPRLFYRPLPSSLQAVAVVPIVVIVVAAAAAARATTPRAASRASGDR